jgi:hypothetical protein
MRTARLHERLTLSFLALTQHQARVRLAAMGRRPRRYSVSLTEAEAEMLRTLAEAQGIDRSDVIRLQIRRAWADRNGSPPTQAAEATR